MAMSLQMQPNNQEIFDDQDVKTASVSQFNSLIETDLNNCNSKLRKSNNQVYKSTEANKNPGNIFAQAIATNQSYAPVPDRTSIIAEDFFKSALMTPQNLDVVSEHFESDFGER